MITALKIFLTIVLFGILIGFNLGCREYRINNCEDQGGVAVVPPLFSHDPIGVSCINEEEL